VPGGLKGGAETPAPLLFSVPGFQPGCQEFYQHCLEVVNDHGVSQVTVGTVTALARHIYVMPEGSRRGHGKEAPSTSLTRSEFAHILLFIRTRMNKEQMTKYIVDRLTRPRDLGALSNAAPDSQWPTLERFVLDSRTDMRPNPSTPESQGEGGAGPSGAGMVRKQAGSTDATPAGREEARRQLFLQAEEQHQGRSDSSGAEDQPDGRDEPEQVRDTGTVDTMYCDQLETLLSSGDRRNAQKV
jgi:hypothetical protein